MEKTSNLDKYILDFSYYGSAIMLVTYISSAIMLVTYFVIFR